MIGPIIKPLSDFGPPAVEKRRDQFETPPGASTETFLTNECRRLEFVIEKMRDEKETLELAVETLKRRVSSLEQDRALAQGEIYKL